MTDLSIEQRLGQRWKLFNVKLIKNGGAFTTTYDTKALTDFFTANQTINSIVTIDTTGLRTGPDKSPVASMTTVERGFLYLAQKGGQDIWTNFPLKDLIRNQDHPDTFILPDDFNGQVDWSSSEIRFFDPADIEDADENKSLWLAISYK